MTAPRADLGTYELDGWRPSVSREEYEAAIEHIRAYIAAGDTYQVNYTLRLYSRFRGDPLALYRDMGQVQESALCAYFDLGRHVLISASPELFFRLQDGRCTVRPMKGTRPRGRFAAEDQLRADDLQNSAKDRAENLMVTDMLRNDLGRIAQVGSVAVPALWSVERYPTVWQLTSTVESQLRASVSLPDIFAALFPLRLGDRRAQGADHGNHRRAGARPARHLHRLHGLCVSWAGGVLQRGDSHGASRPRERTTRIWRGRRDRLGIVGRGRIRRMPHQGRGLARPAASFL